ncbi:ATP-binding cassette domain-containing protein [Paenibacillus alkalitolerans]|uniref:ATP-binding cassette domain-containing protein n=1 Tax=Paenibacillus alkalitolerans TaxID=2799335 RepID=UPI0018F39B37|nr:ATP-binding cassette domain-containing protein [Paenibacillus alkalitolerans]
MEKGADKPIISMRNVFFRYDNQEKWALKGIDLDIYQGEWVAVAGGNGSGKSTLARLMNALLFPVEGEVTVFGKNPFNKKDVWDIRRQAGMVFQNPDEQSVGQTAADDIAFGLENLGVPEPEIRERSEAVMKQLGLADYKNTDPSRLSPGRRQLLAIAGVLAMEPKAVIFDEACSMLDPLAAQNVYRAMCKLHRQGMAIIHITHEPEEIYWAQRIVILREGTVFANGTVREALENSYWLYEAGLLPPFAVRIRDGLFREGIRLSPDMTTEDRLREELWTLLSSK